MSESTTRRPYQALIALGAGMLVYLALAWPALHGPFFFDDFPNLDALSKSGDVHSARDLGIYLSEARSFPGRPLAMLSFLPQRQDWPDNPLPFKQVNLLIHLLNAALVYLLFAALGKNLFPDRQQTRSWIAAVAAFAWLVHPIQLSAVMLVIQRMTLLSTLFTLAGLLAYVHAIGASGLSDRTRAIRIVLGLGGGTTLAFLCKESGLLLPLYAWVIDATLMRPDVAGLSGRLQAVRRLSMFPVIAVVMGFLAWVTVHASAPLPGRDFTVADRLLTEPRVLFDYLSNIVVPRYAAFGIYHDDYLLSRTVSAPWTTLPAILGVFGALVIAIVSRVRVPLLAFAILWYLGGHVMESGPIPLELYFDHRNYLPLAGPLFAAAAGLAGLPDTGIRRALTGAGFVWLLACLMGSALYARVWSSQSSLAFFFSSAHPASVRAQGERAEDLFKSGHPAEARRIIQATADRVPGDASPRISLVFIDCSTRSLKTDDVTRLRTLLAHSRWNRLVFEGLEPLREQAVANSCAPALDDRAWLSLSDAVMANPSFQSDPIALGNLHYQRHLLAVARGDLGAALAELEATEKVDPDPEIVRLQAKYLMDAGLPEEAVRRLRAYDPSRRPLLRRLLVDDVAINREAIATIQSRAAAATRPH
jgi:protein O-mannosyl-transferase